MRLPEDLTEAERKLLAAIAAADPANFCTGDPKEDNPANGASWGDERTIRAEVIRALCLGAEDQPPLDPKGLSVYGARIEGALDLEAGTITTPLRILGSHFADQVSLPYATAKLLDLSGSFLARGLNARRIVLEHDAILCEGFTARGEVRLVGAAIGGMLNCSGGTFENPEGWALSADGMSVKGGVFLSTIQGAEGELLAPFTAKGEVRLLGADITGQLDCSGGAFENPNGCALNADGMSVNGGVFLSSVQHPDGKLLAPFTAKGEVRLLDADITGQLDCSGGTFDNPEGRALSADRMSVKGDVYLSISQGLDGLPLAQFTTRGEVRLVGAKIGGQLDCSGGSFQNPRGYALNAHSMSVRGSVFLRTIQGARGQLLAPFTAKGEVRLLGADITGQLDCSGGTFENPDGVALSADRMSVKGSVFLSTELLAQFTARGEVCLLGAVIGGALDCRGGTFFENPKGYALVADGISVNGDVLLSTVVSAGDQLLAAFTAQGQVRLPGAEIGGQLDCSGGTFENPKGVALGADQMSVKDGVFLSTVQGARGQLLAPFTAKGEVRLLGADITGQLDCSGGTFENPDGVALSADRMSVKGSVFLSTELLAQFTAWGDVCLLGAVIGGALDCRDGTFENRLVLAGATVNELGDREPSWPQAGQLELDGFEYKRFGADAPNRADSRIEWLHRQPRKPFRMQPYEQLIGVFRAEGRESDARKVAIQKQVDLRRNGQLGPLARVWSLMLGFFVGHGYRPGRAVLFAIVVIGVGVYVFHRAQQDGAIEPTDDIVSASALPASYPKFNPIVYSLDVFLPIIDLHQEDEWVPSNAPPTGWLGQLSKWLHIPGEWFYWIYMWLHIALGWILTTFIVAALTGLIKKD